MEIQRPRSTQNGRRARTIRLSLLIALVPDLCSLHEEVPMQPLTAPVVKPADDIEVVLGRFQAWSDSRRPKIRTDDMIDGVRELSYEEALQSSRTRWQARTE